MRAGLSLLVLLPCLLVSRTVEVRATERGETRVHDLQRLEPDTTTDQSDIWIELRMLRDMVVEQKVELRNMAARLRETEMQADEQKLDLLLTTTSLGELKRDHSALEERQRSSEKQVEELKKVNAELRVDLENQTAELLSRVTLCDGELQLLTHRVDDLQAHNTAQDVQLQSVIDRVNAAERAKVAFYAALTDSEGVGPYDTPTVLKFSKVFTNVGKAYSPTTGFFTAPLRGVYYFRFTICGHTSEGRMGVQLFHNGRSIMFNLQGRYNVHFEYLSNGVTLELNAGDFLYLVLPEENAIFDNVNNHSTFTGFLLFSM